MKNVAFIKEHYAEQIHALNSFIEDAYSFLPNQDKYIDLSNHIRVLEKKNNIKVDVLVSQNTSPEYLLDNSKVIFSSDVYVESIEDIIPKKIVYRRNDNLTRDIIDIAIAIKFKDGILQDMLGSGLINELDLKELKTSLENLDKKTFEEEIEIVAPFENYINDSKNAPEIIKEECQKILT